jgi:hypothetical protein
MRIATWGRIGIVAAGLALAACGGGGGGSNTVSLKSRDDVVREVANLSILYVDGGAPAASAKTRSIGARGLMTRTLAGRQRTPAKNASPKTTTACDSGSLTYDNFYGVVRSLPLFGVDPTVDYYLETNSSCKFVDGSYSELYSGRYEEGGNIGYTAGSAESPLYEYYQDGEGGAPYRMVLQDTAYDEKLTFTSLGRVESRDTGTAFESREVYGVDIVYVFGGDSVRIGIDTGESANPLIFVDNYGGDTSLSIDGPMRYTSSFCEGGALEYATLTNLTVASDGSGTYINGGELTITSGSASVTLVFESDGDVQYTLSGGGSGLVTRAELANATGECVFTI